MGVYRYGLVMGLGVSKAFEKGIANEEMGFLELGVEKMGRVQKTH